MWSLYWMMNCYLFVGLKIKLGSCDKNLQIVYVMIIVKHILLSWLCSVQSRSYVQETL